MHRHQLDHDWCARHGPAVTETLLFGAGTASTKPTTSSHLRETRHRGSSDLYWIPLAPDCPTLNNCCGAGSSRSAVATRLRYAANPATPQPAGARRQPQRTARSSSRSSVATRHRRNAGPGADQGQRLPRSACFSDARNPAAVTGRHAAPGFPPTRAPRGGASRPGQARVAPGRKPAVPRAHPVAPSAKFLPGGRIRAQLQPASSAPGRIAPPHRRWAPPDRPRLLAIYTDRCSALGAERRPGYRRAARDPLPLLGDSANVVFVLISDVVSAGERAIPPLDDRRRSQRAPAHHRHLQNARAAGAEPARTAGITLRRGAAYATPATLEPPPELRRIAVK